MFFLAEIAVIDCINLIFVKARLFKQILQSLRIIMVIVIVSNFRQILIIGLVVLITLNFNVVGEIIIRALLHLLDQLHF